MDAKTQEAMRKVSHYIANHFTMTLVPKRKEGDRNGSHLTKKLHARNRNQAGVQWFARSISLRRTSTACFIYGQTGCFFDGNSATMWCNVPSIWLTVCSTQIAIFDSNLLEHVAKFWFLFWRMKWGKTSSMSNKQNTITQYSSDINTMREISEILSSSRQTAN